MWGATDADADAGVTTTTAAAVADTDVQWLTLVLVLIQMTFLSCKGSKSDKTVPFLIANPKYILRRALGWNA